MPATAAFASSAPASLASLLLSKAGSSKDVALDSLFRSNAPVGNGIERPSKRKRVTAADLMSDSEDVVAPTDAERRARKQAKRAAKAAKKAALAAVEGSHPSLPAEETRVVEVAPKKSKKAKTVAAEDEEAPRKSRKRQANKADADHEVEAGPAANGGFTEASATVYAPVKSKKQKKRVVEAAADADIDAIQTSTQMVEAPVDNDDDDADDSSETEAVIVHESLDPHFASSSAARGTKAARELADAEDPAHRSARTIFIGNVPLSCATSKPVRKSLQAHLLTQLPAEAREATKIDAIRFRGLPLPEAIGDKALKPRKAPIENPNHQQRRMSAFRGQLLGSTAADEDDAAAKALEHQHKFLTAAQKRKVAAITGDVNINGESCLAYVVINDADRARALITAADGSIFMGRTLRVDTVRPPGAKKGDAPTETTAEEKKRLAEEERRTCFVGGLDFAETEEGLRKWVEAKLTEERGEAEADDEEDIPSGGIRWVQRVRIVRDKATGLGKGFAYVLLRDRDCVDELLALPATEAKLSKRKLRFQRCKSAAKLEAEAAKPAQKLAAKEQRAQLGKLPKSAQVKATKRDPTKARAMAKKLEGLSKDERKAVKSTDAERQARRAAKKQEKLMRERKERKRAIRAKKAG